MKPVEWEGRHFSLLLGVEPAVAAYRTCGHTPGKVWSAGPGPLTADSRHLRSLVWAPGFSASLPPSQSPPGNVLGSPRRITAEMTAEWLALAHRACSRRAGEGGVLGQAVSRGLEITFPGCF